jgi:hypothetical protein
MADKGEGESSAVCFTIPAIGLAGYSSAKPESCDGYSFSSKIRHSLGVGGREKARMRASQIAVARKYAFWHLPSHQLVLFYICVALRRPFFEKMNGKWGKLKSETAEVGLR